MHRLSALNPNPPYPAHQLHPSLILVIDETHRVQPQSVVQCQHWKGPWEHGAHRFSVQIQEGFHRGALGVTKGSVPSPPFQTLYTRASVCFI